MHLFKFSAYSTLICLISAGLLFTGCQGDNSDNSEDTQQQEQQQGQQQSQKQKKIQQMMQQRQQAATDVSDEELKGFAEAVKKIQSVQQGAQTEMKEALDESGMQAQRYNEIMQKKRNPRDSVSMTAEEEQQFSDASKKIQNIRTETQPEIQQAIKDAGLTMERYRSIMMAVRQDTTLQKKVKNYMQN